MKFSYTTTKTITLTGEQAEQCINHLRESDFYTKKDKSFYYGHFLQSAHVLGFIGLEPNWKVPDASMVEVKGKKILYMD